MENLNIDTMEDSLTLDAIEDLNLDMNEVQNGKKLIPNKVRFTQI